MLEQCPMICDFDVSWWEHCQTNRLTHNLSLKKPWFCSFQVCTSCTRLIHLLSHMAYNMSLWPPTSFPYLCPLCLPTSPVSPHFLTCVASLCPTTFPPDILSDALPHFCDTQRPFKTFSHWTFCCIKYWLRCHCVWIKSMNKCTNIQNLKSMNSTVRQEASRQLHLAVKNWEISV